MNMPTRRGRRGPERKEFQQLYSWDQVPPMVDQGFICTLFGISRNTIVRYHKADVMRMAGLDPDHAA